MRLLGVALISSAFVLSACGGSETGGGSRSEPEAAAESPSVLSGVIDDEQFLGFVRDDVQGFDRFADDQVVEMASLVCDVLQPNSQDSWLEAVKVLTAEPEGLDGGEAGSFIAYSVAHSCPEKESALVSSG